LERAAADVDFLWKRGDAGGHPIAALGRLLRQI